MSTFSDAAGIICAILAVVFLAYSSFGVRYSRRHVLAARPLHKSIVIIFGGVAFACIVAGIVALLFPASAGTEFTMLGASFKTGHVGVAFLGIGLVVAFLTIKAVLKNVVDLAKLRDEPSVLRKKKSKTEKKA